MTLRVSTGATESTSIGAPLYHHDTLTRMVSLTDDEARDLVQTILEAVAHLEEHSPLRESWSFEAVDWCTLIIDRLAEGEQ